MYKSERLRKRRARRILLWSAVGILVLAGAIGGGIYLWLDSRLGPHLTTTSGPTATIADPVPEPPESTDILLLGSDKRPTNSGEETRSDTVMLVHVDKESDYLSILSLPRDLLVDIPGHNSNRLNAAYSIGGWELTKQTVEQLTGVPIEHCIQVDFKAFSDMTDSVGGVYLDVDRRYYNDTAGSSYELIKISPGYQLLNGTDALDYVRFRHDDNYDFGRMLRQQRFMTALREQAMDWTDIPGLVSALFSNLYTDPDLGTMDLIKLAYWGTHLGGSRIRQVSVIGDIVNREIDGAKASVVVVADGAIEEAVRQLLTPPSASAAAQPTGGATTAAPTTTTAMDRSTFITDLDAIPNSRLWRLYADAASFQVMAPGYLPPGYAYVDKNPAAPGTYDIDIGGGKTEPAIKMVYQLTRNGYAIDQYMGIMQTTWLDAPAASEAREQVTYNGMTYNIVGTTQNTDHVWWIKDGVLYWVSNTLSYVLNARDLLKVAESMIAVPSGVTP